MCLTAREFGAEEALAVGFVSSVHENKAAALARAHELAALIASKSPVAVQGTKEVLNYSRDHSIADGRQEATELRQTLDTDLLAGLNYVKVWNASMLQTRDVQDAMLANKEKRKATFAKL